MYLRAFVGVVFTLVIVIGSVAGKDVKVFRRGKVAIVDETQFKFPNDYNFDDDEEKPVDTDNAYDEKVPYLPRYILRKNGQNQGFTRVPIVTRKGNTWSTPRPVTHKGDQYVTWTTPKVEPVTRPPKVTRPPTHKPTTKIPVPTFVPKEEKKPTTTSTVAPTTKTTPTTTTAPTTTKHVKKTTTVALVLPPLVAQVEKKKPVTPSQPLPPTTTRVPTTKKTTHSRPTTHAPTTVTATTEAPVVPTTKVRPVFKGARRNFLSHTNAPPSLPPTDELVGPFVGSKLVGGLRPVPLTKPLSRGVSALANRPDPVVSGAAQPAPSTTASPSSLPPPEENLDGNGVDEPLSFDSTEARLANFHFSKFAQRFGIRRVVPAAATTKTPVIVARPITVAPVVVAGSNLVDQKVKSNTLVLQQSKTKFFLPSNQDVINASVFQKNKPPPTTPPTVVHRWSSAWSSWSSWDAQGHRQTGSTRSFSTFNDVSSTTSTSTLPPTPAPTTSVVPTTTAPRLRPVFRSRFTTLAVRNQPLPTIATISTAAPAPETPSTAAPKPPVIQHGSARYHGPTFNCRVLTPIEDGRPSARNDASCKLKYPGFPADDTCRCTYEVEGRDERGCATGFLYTCARKVYG